MRRRRTRAALLVAALATAGVACTDDATPLDASTTSTTTTSTTSTTVASTTSTTTTVATTTTATTIEPAPPPGGLALVDRLAVAEPDTSIPPYERDRFGDDWDYDPASGCNTRERVLAAEAVELVAVDDRCRPTGTWVSAYDGVRTDDPADLQIDHLVPLADAWRSGAWTWSDERRRAFANHLDDPEELIAVTGRTNQSKSDSTPDQWLPPDRGAWCDYASDWVEVKARWDLTVTPAEKATLVQLLSGC